METDEELKKKKKSNEMNIESIRIKISRRESVEVGDVCLFSKFIDGKCVAHN